MFLDFQDTIEVTMRTRNKAILLLLVLLLINFIWEHLKGDVGPSNAEIFFFGQLKALSQNLPPPSVLIAAIYALALSILVNLALPVLPIFALIGPQWFGVPITWLLCTIGLSTGTILPFLLARIIGSEKRKAKVQAWVPGAWQTLVAFRLSPLVPIWIVSAGAGLMSPTRLSFRRYLGITAIGIQPLLWCYIVAGRNLFKVETFKDVLDFRLVAALTALAVVSYFATSVIARDAKT